MTVVGVLAHAYVGDHAQVRLGGLHGVDRLLDDPAGVVGPRAARVLALRKCRRESRREPRIDHALGLDDEAVDREAVHARHRHHGLAHAVALDDEERQDQVVAAERRSRAPCGEGSRCGAGAAASSGGSSWGSSRMALDIRAAKTLPPAPAPRALGQDVRRQPLSSQRLRRHRADGRADTTAVAAARRCVVQQRDEVLDRGRAREGQGVDRPASSNSARIPAASIAGGKVR